ncbi:MAG: hypothetical protein BIP78_0062 [Candidatus Bipolaricaulis sibiricus]|uniref:NADPH-dependent FMN reductase-like domain-containing protein n=1 Tax=Bipolaricaulis sibiricus TaxID=2501609 RepID=A0A410FSD2_BIPS1|nr:MAG: hypothetical protein BIP78_0062 [Candidatus Bipolaricaulis sibiricus]
MSEPVLVAAASNHRRSNSAAIGRYLADALVTAGVRAQILDVAESGGLQDDFRPAVEALTGHGHVVLVASLYHDAINAVAAATLEAWADAARGDLPRLFSAIVHSGYPEPVHTEVALAICRKFASDVGWGWRGGLTVGATSAIGGNDLQAAGPPARHLRRALDLTAAAFARGEPVPEAAVRTATRAAMPRWLYIAVGNWMMRREARRLGTVDLDRRPYAREADVGGTCLPARPTPGAGQDPRGQKSGS